MANCIKCERDVGCSCNLIMGLCMTCYNLNLNNEAPDSNFIIRDVPPPNTEFTNILSNNTITQEQKLKAINDILFNGGNNSIIGT